MHSPSFTAHVYTGRQALGCSDRDLEWEPQRSSAEADCWKQACAQVSHSFSPHGCSPGKSVSYTHNLKGFQRCVGLSKLWECGRPCFQPVGVAQKGIAIDVLSLTRAGVPKQLFASSLQQQYMTAPAQQGITDLKS